jgi:hypothetical protein
MLCRPRSKIQISPFFCSLEKCGPLRHKWKINIIMDLKEIGWVGVNRIRLAQDRHHGNEFLSSTVSWDFRSKISST